MDLVLFSPRSLMIRAVTPLDARQAVLCIHIDIVSPLSPLVISCFADASTSDCIDQSRLLANCLSAGFSAGVNKIVIAAPDAPYCVIVSTDILFQPAALAEISE